MAKIKALKTITGTYGTIQAGKTAEVTADVAADLQNRKLAEVVTEKKEEKAATALTTKEEKSPKDTK